MRKIPANAIKITPNAASHVINTFVQRFNQIFASKSYEFEDDIDNNIEKKIINELRNAIVRGLVLYNHPSEDTHNPSDRQLEIYTYINLNSLDSRIKGIAKLKVLCRLSLFNGTLSLRSIQRNFVVE